MQAPIANLAPVAARGLREEKHRQEMQLGAQSPAVQVLADVLVAIEGEQPWIPAAVGCEVRDGVEVLVGLWERACVLTCATAALPAWQAHACRLPLLRLPKLR